MLSPGNTADEMRQKRAFYTTYGVEEYYLYDPNRNRLSGWRRNRGRLQPITPMSGWTSPRLGVQFQLSRDELRLFRPDGRPFLTFVELQQQFVELQQQSDQAVQRAEQAEQRAEHLAARLRELGFDPEA